MLLSSCVSGTERFTVDGNIGDPLAAAPGSKVYLLGPDGWEEALDSTSVKGGKFTFKGEIDKTTLLTAVLHYPGMDPFDSRNRVQFIPERTATAVGKKRLTRRALIPDNLPWEIYDKPSKPSTPRPRPAADTPEP